MSRLRPRLQQPVIAVLVGTWLLLPLLNAAQDFARLRSEGSGLAFGVMLWQRGAPFLPWLLLTPLLLLVAGRMAAWRPWRAVLGHVAFGAVIVLVHALLMLALAALQGAPTRGVLTYWVVGSGVITLVYYGLAMAIIHSFRFARGLRERELERAQLEAQLAHARLDALRLQLQPHFLFNALNAIAALIHEDPDRADDMVERLSEFLRVVLEERGEREVPVREELQLLDVYLDIQATRFGERLRWRSDVDPDVRDALLPPLLLQPLVENAVRHGIETRAHGGFVALRAERAGERLRIRVSDGGDDAVRTRAAAGFGVGLANTRARLQHLYGAAHRLELERGPDGDATVTLELPLRFSGEPHPA